MNRYYISVAGWNGAGVTAPCIIIGQEFEAETEREAGEAAEKSAYVVKNGMRVRAAVTSYSLNEYAEATLQELVAMLAETHTGEPEEHEQTFDDLTDEVENEANNEDV